MINLREQEAVDYLRRVEAVVTTSSVSGLVVNMVGLEIAFLERVIKIPELKEVAEVTIDETGFPVVESWYVDCKRAWEEDGAIGKRRIKSILPVVEQLANPRFDPSALQVNHFDRAWESCDRALSAANGKFDGMQTDLFSEASYKPTFPLKVWPGELPGMLLVSEPRTDEERDKKADRRITRWSQEPRIAVKYIDQMVAADGREYPSILLCCDVDKSTYYWSEKKRRNIDRPKPVFQYRDISYCFGQSEEPSLDELVKQLGKYRGSEAIHNLLLPHDFVSDQSIPFTSFAL